MSTFTPTQWTFDPPARPDQLSSAVLQSLGRPILGKLAWGPIKSLVLGGLTFGILPLLAWPRKFNRFVVAEQQQLWHLTEWLRVNTGDEQAAKVRDSVRSAGPVPTLWLVPVVMLVILAVNFLPWVGVHEANVDRIFYATYGPPARFERLFDGGWLNSPHSLLHFFGIWTICLSVAFISHWAHVRAHARRINLLIDQLNPIFQRQNLPLVEWRDLGGGFRPLWGVVAIIGVVSGAWWAIPAAFAGCAHYRYIRSTSLRIRNDLAQRVRTLLQRQRPAMDVPTPYRLRSVCRNTLCAKPIPQGAAFCPRCGTRLAPSLDAVA
jgi:hypothetical protein